MTYPSRRTISRIELQRWLESLIELERMKADAEAASRRALFGIHSTTINIKLKGWVPHDPDNCVMRVWVRHDPATGQGKYVQGQVSTLKKGNRKHRHYTTMWDIASAILDRGLYDENDG